MEELFVIITWKQLGLFLNPIVILNIDGYYNPLIEMLHNAIGGNGGMCGGDRHDYMAAILRMFLSHTGMF